MIGVLALQGAFLEHLAAFAALCVEAKEVREPIAAAPTCTRPRAGSLTPVKDPAR